MSVIRQKNLDHCVYLFTWLAKGIRTLVGSPSYRMIASRLKHKSQIFQVFDIITMRQRFFLLTIKA